MNVAYSARRSASLKVEAGVGPLLTQGPVEPFDLAVGLGAVGAGSFVLDGAKGLGEKL